MINLAAKAAKKKLHENYAGKINVPLLRLCG